MKKLWILPMVALLLLSIAYAGFEDEMGTHWDEAEQTGYVYQPFFEGGLAFSLATLTGSNTYEFDFYPGQTIKFRADPTAWNVNCANAQVVVEVYTPMPEDQFYKAFHSGTFVVQSGSTDAQRYKHYDFTWTAPSGKYGTWNAVGYIICNDPNSDFYNEIISRTDTEKTSFRITEANNPDTCVTHETDPYCSGSGDLVKIAYTCNPPDSEVIVIDDCGTGEYCNGNACAPLGGGDPANPEPKICDVDEDCGDGFKCQSGKCMSLQEGGNLWIWILVALGIIIMFGGVGFFLMKKK